ncbi:polysaccharide biosynthesis/export family protein [Croceicoccus sp. Ery15]|uniref:polysaccharide biosynthesis/export family protein n=1 Tax=Croceicoccus sp. Ery15 TaxID=1703338 RepID=UPI001E4B7BAA|nr:polysaccharide biosynthesis/export family protein [Croceicoccus sp. Ery15]
MDQFTNMLRLPVILLAMFSLAGCVKSLPPIESTATLTVVEGASALPAPQRTDLLADARPALIGPLDMISVEIFGVPELSKQIQVDTGGRIEMPLIGTLDAGGKTPAELAKDIETALSGRYVRDPNVTVNITSSVSQVVTIDGQVVEPGLYPVTNQMTLMRTIASARGLTEFAKVDDVVILRNVGGQKLAGLYNVQEIRRGAYEDPAVYANDLIVVGDSPQRRMFKDIVSTAPLVAAPLVALIN